MSILDWAKSTRHGRRLLVFVVASALLITGLPTTASAIVRIQGTAGNFASIQAAVDAASPGDTVIVFRGTYPENVLIPKPLTLRGVGHPVVAPFAGIPVNIDNPAGPVTIEGLDVAVPTGMQGIFYDGFSDADSNLGVIRRCRITGGQTGIFAKEADMKIEHNVISGFSLRGILVVGSGSATEIGVQKNQITGQPVLSNLGMTIINASASVEGNKVNSTFSSAIQVASCSGTVRTNELADNRVGINLIESPNVVVEHNTVEASNVFTTTINATSFPVGHVRVFQSDGVQIRNNTLAGGNSGISLLESTGVLVEANIIRDTITAAFTLAVGIVVATGSTGAQIHNNNIFGNVSFGVRDADGTNGIIDATNNWWGASDGPSGVGPGSGDAVTTNISFVPFLTAPNPSAGA